jgi:two-component system, LytTR family, response regulator
VTATAIPAVLIFLTAHEQHALKAVEVHALDYLLKPVDDDRLTEALGHARKLISSEGKNELAERIPEMLGPPTKYVSRFTVTTGSRIQIVLAEHTDWLSAAGDYAELHVRGRAHLIRETMNALEQKLDPAKFLRIHRSRIVRASCVVELRSLGNRDYWLKLSDGSEHRSSRTYAPGPGELVRFRQGLAAKSRQNCAGDCNIKPRCWADVKPCVTKRTRAVPSFRSR